MFLFQLFRSFQPLHNPIGFGAVDFVELALAALLVLLIVLHARLAAYAQWLAVRTVPCMLVLALLPLLLRLAMLAESPVPTPNGADDFAHLLAADTLRHFRLANPSHAMHQFFETVFVVQQPAYASIFPIGQGLALAFGWLVFAQPWAGVLLSVSALCALCYWMLRAWTTPGWAFVGGLFAVMEFGPLRYWANTYWGGAVSAIAGCLVFGTLPCLRRRYRTRHALLLGLGIGLQWLARPFECLLLLAAVALYFLPAPRRLARALPVVLLTLLPAIGLTLLHNRQITGSWTTSPYILSRYQYGVPTTFTFQPNPVPHLPLTADQQADYDAQVIVHGAAPETVKTYLDRLAGRVRFYRFFFLAPLYLALPFSLLLLRQFRFLWVAVALALFSLGDNFYPYFYPHYIAAATCLFVLAGVAGLARLARLQIRGSPVGLQAAQWIVFLCAAQFIFWYGMHLFAGSNASQAMRDFETWDYVNHGDPDGRIAVNQTLAQAAGRQLVFIRYWPQHRFQEWVHNAADIDKSQVVWALDLGPAEDEKLRRYYPDRTPWLLEPDARPPKLTQYRVETQEPPAQENGIQVLPF